MEDDAFESFDEIVAHPVFPEVDLRLREGAHIDDGDLEHFTFLEDARALLEVFYERFGCDLERSVDRYYFLRPRGDRLGRRQLTAAEMLVGQALCLLRMDPGSLHTQFWVDRTRVIELLDQLVGRERLSMALNPRRKSRSRAVEEGKIRGDIDSAIHTLARLGFVGIDGERLQPRVTVMRFIEPFVEHQRPAAALTQAMSIGLEAMQHGEDEVP